jgi:hypothetical protein
MNLINTIKKTIIASLALSATISCSNKVDVIGEWKEIPVVYAVFSPLPENGDNYFRIEKAFLDPDTDAFQIAQNPDSIYYGPNELEVVVYERTETNPYRVLDTLERIDANTLGFVRDSGIFANNPNYVYVMRNRPIGGSTRRSYKMVIKNNRTGKTFTQYCDAILMGNYRPSENSYEYFNITNPANPNNSSSRPINFCGRNPITSDFEFQDVNYTWNQPTNATIYDLTATFRYYEYQENNGVVDSSTWSEKSISWKVLRNYVPDNIGTNGDAETVKVSGENFYNFLKNNLSDVTNTNIRRCAHRIDLRIDCGGPELAELISTRNANSSLIGGLFPVDPYSNIEDGIGIFSYKFHLIKTGYKIGAESIEYLSESDDTKKLGFRALSCN